MVCRDQRAGARHILHNDVWISGNVLAPVLGYEARMSVVLASRGGPCDERNSLALIKGSLGLKGGLPCQTNEKAEKHFLHCVFLPLTHRALRSLRDPSG